MFPFPVGAPTGTVPASIMPDTRQWAVNLDMTAANNMPQNPSQGSGSPEEQQATSPLSHASSPNSQHSSLQLSPFSSPLTPWTLHQQQQQQQHQQAVLAAQQQRQQHLPATDLSQFMNDPTLMGFNGYSNNFPQNALDYIPPTTQAALQANLLESAFPMGSMEEQAQSMQWNTGMENWHDLSGHIHMDGLPRLDSVGSNSPTNTYLEVLSVPSSAGESWTFLDWPLKLNIVGEL